MIRMLTSTAILLAGILVFNSCNDDEPKTTPNDASSVVGNTGGSLTAQDGVITLTVPQGAMADNTTVAIKESEEVSPENGIGKVYSLTPEGTQFTKPVALSFHYTDKDAAKTPPSRMAIAFKKDDNTWQVVPTINIDEATKTITTETLHFSEWTLLEIPSITNFTPDNGIEGTVVTITGTNFSSVISENVVSINGVSATVLAASTTQLSIKVPSAVTTGKITIVITQNGQSYTIVSQDDFVVNVPTITSFSPASAIVGTTVTITGTNFSTNLSENVVTFNGIPALVTAVTGNQIVTKVPAGATTGKIFIAVVVNTFNYTVSSANDFVVESSEPTVIDFTPASGVVGTTVTINGKNFSAIPSENSVTFSGFPGTVTSSSTTQLVVIVPVGAKTGKFMVQTIYNNLAWTTSPDTEFVVETNEPTVTGFSPASGPTGTLVTVTGKNFSATASDNKVFFNGNSAVVTSSSSTQIVFALPAGASDKILVQTKFNDLDWVTSSANDFIVTP